MTLRQRKMDINTKQKRISDKLIEDNLRKSSAYTLNIFYSPGVTLFMILVLISITASCARRIKITDISDNLSYADLIGKVYRTNVRMDLHGIKYDLRSDTIDFYSIVAPPGIGGPEILPQGKLPIGSLLKIKKIIQLAPSLFSGPSIRHVVEILDNKSFKNLEAEIYEAFGTYTTPTAEGEIPKLSTVFFKEI